MKGKHYVWSALAGLVALLIFGVAAPAWATDHYPTVPWTGVGEEVVDENLVTLTKEEPGDGANFETKNLDLDGPKTITVSFFLEGGASFSAGAVRMFWYDVPNADTSATGTAPTDFDWANSDSGTLTLDIPDGKTVGTFGLTYDASNDSIGTVKFADLAFGQDKILFLAPAPPTTAPATTAPVTTAPATTAPATTAPATTAPATTAPATTSPAAEPEDCEAYLYAGSQDNLCDRFSGNLDDVDCKDVGYRVDLVDVNNDPWGLDDGGEPGAGCESYGTRQTSEPTTEAPVGGGGGLPLTGNPTMLIGSAGAVLLAVGVALVVMTIRRRRGDGHIATDTALMDPIQ